MKKNCLFKVPEPYKFNGKGVEHFGADALEIVALTNDGKILHDNLTNPDVKPWFLVRVHNKRPGQRHSAWGYPTWWTRVILTDGEVFHNKIEYSSWLTRKHYTRACHMNETNRLKVVQEIKEFVKAAVGE